MSLRHGTAAEGLSGQALEFKRQHFNPHEPSIAEKQWVSEPYDPIIDLLVDYKQLSQQFGYLGGLPNL